MTRFGGWGWGRNTVGKQRQCPGARQASGHLPGQVPRLGKQRPAQLDIISAHRHWHQRAPGCRHHRWHAGHPRLQAGRQPPHRWCRRQPGQGQAPGAQAYPGAPWRQPGWRTASPGTAAAAAASPILPACAEASSRQRRPRQRRRRPPRAASPPQQPAPPTQHAARAGGVAERHVGGAAVPRSTEAVCT